MKIELPCRSVPPSPIADIGRHVAHAHVPHLHVVPRRPIRARRPSRAAHAGCADPDGRCSACVCAWFMVTMSGNTARPDIVVVVGGDAHALRALDQEGRVADIGDAHLIATGREPQRQPASRAAGATRSGRGSFPSSPAWRPAAARLARAAPAPGATQPTRPAPSARQ